MGEAYKKIAIKKINSEYCMPVLSDTLYFKELKTVFESFGIPSAYYNFNGYSEDAICIESSAGMWIVYNGEKGNKYDISQYSNILAACHNLILRVSESDEERIQMQNVFEKSLNRYIMPQNQIATNNGYIRNSGDKYSLEVQIAVLSVRIQELTEYLKVNPKDRYSKRKLLRMTGQRRRLLFSLKHTDRERYCTLIERLGIER